MAIVFYIHAREIKEARSSGNWDAVYAGLTLFGMDFVNETWNGWVLHFSQRSACWTLPGETALRTLVGWNIEIMFMFAISGIIYYNTLSERRNATIMGLPDRWFWAVGYAAFCVFVEILLNIGGLLVWAYPWWTRSLSGVWLIFLFGYFHFYVAIIIVLGLKTLRARIWAVASLYIIAAAANIVCMGFLGWVY